MDRRGFLGAILAAAVAPAIVRADSLMRIVPRGMLLLAEPRPILTIDALRAEILKTMHSNMVYINAVNRQYDARLAQADVLEAPTIRMRRPVQFRTGR